MQQRGEMMETKGRFIDWRLSMAETISGIITATGLTAGILLWSIKTYQSKEDAVEMKRQLEKRIEGVEAQITTMRTSLENVARDTSYIRGRLEPKSKEQ